MSTTIAPIPAPEHAPSTTVAPPAVAPNAPSTTSVKPTPQELRSGALFSDPTRLRAWLGDGTPAAPPAAPAADATAETTPTPGGQVRRADGTFGPKDGDGATAPAEAPATTETPVEPAAEATKGKETTAPAFEVVGADGKPVALDLATAKVRTRAGGEVVELSIPDLVRSAKSEAGAQRLAQRNEMLLREATQTFTAERAESTATIEDLRALAREYLTSDAARLRDLAALQAYESPEEVAERERKGRERAETALTTERAQTAQQREIDGFYAEFGGPNGVQRHQDSLLEQYPHVSAEELIGRFTADIARLGIQGPDGRIPPEQLPALRTYLTTELPAFCRQRHESRATQQQTSEAATRKREEATAAERDRARVESQRAKNDLAAATRPMGGAGLPGEPSRPRPKTLDEATAGALAFARTATGG